MKVTGSTVGTGFIPTPEALPPGDGSRPPLRIRGPITDTPLRTCASCRKMTAQAPCHECGAEFPATKRSA